MNVHDKVRKLLALSGSANEHEARAAFEAATRLLALHQLTLQDVLEPPLLRIAFQKPTGWQLGLLVVCAKATGTVLVSGDVTCRLYATDQALLDTARALFESLRTSLVAMAPRAWQLHVEELTDPVLGRYPSTLEPGADQAWIQSWLVGVVLGFHESLVPTQEAAARSASQSLVKLRAPSDALLDRVKKEFHITGATVATRHWAEGVTMDVGSMRAGRAHGRTL